MVCDIPMKSSSTKGIVLIILSFVPVLFRLSYDYNTWFIYFMKMLVDASYISFAWLILSGFRQGVIRKILSQSLHGKFHNYLGYIATVGILIHPIYFAIKWNSWRMLVPFAHPNIYFLFGALSIVLLLITGVSSYFIRKRYYDYWNILHYLNYLFFIFVFIHVWKSLPLYSPTGIYYIIIFIIAVVSMVYKWMFDLRMLSFHTTVQSIALVAKDTYNVRFKVPDHVETWEPGQYVMITIDPMDDHHPFSVSKINSDQTVEITFKVFGNFTKKFSQVVAGQKLYFAGPYGTANKMVQYHKKEDLVLVAGGIGITPFRCIINHLLEKNDQRNIYLFYCVSQPDFFAFDDEFTKLAKQHANFHYIKICSKPVKDPSVIQGYISDLIIKDQIGDLPSHSYVVCGPDAMLAAVNVLLRSHGVPRYQIHKEEFSY